MASPLQNVRPEDMSVVAIIDNNLVQYCNSSSSSSKVDIIAENVRSSPVSTCSVSNVVKNRYVFLVGGILPGGRANYFPPSRDVFFYDLLDQDWPCKRTCGPPLISPKLSPTLIVMGSKLFAFSYTLCNPNSYFSAQFGRPYEILDTASKTDSWQWDIPQPFPELPPLDENGYGDVSNIVSYAADESTNTLYLSLGDLTTIPFTQGTLCIIYNADHDKWVTGTHQPLPFYREGKVFNSLFYGFPCGVSARDCSSLGVYRLVDSTNQNCTSGWVELRRHSLFPGVSKPFPAYFPSLCVLRDDVVSIIRARAPSSLEYYNPHLLEFDVVRLVKMHAEDQYGDTEAPPETIIINHHSSYCHSGEFDAIVGIWWSPSHKGNIIVDQGT